MSILIQNGVVYDGSGSPPIEADVLIEGERIAAVGPHLAVPSGAEVIDAGRRVVCPGFIDVHRHADIAAFTSPDFGETELAQGITSTVVGNCGMSPVPGVGPSVDEYYRYMEPCTGPIPRDLPFADYASYVAALKKLSSADKHGLSRRRQRHKNRDKGLFQNALYRRRNEARHSLYRAGQGGGGAGAVIRH